MSARHPKDLFMQSLSRCIKSGEFIPSFYKRFLSTSDEIMKKFRHTNFQKQNTMLLRSLQLAANATSGDPVALRDLRERAETHNRHHLNIEPELYVFWQTAMIETAREFDYLWDREIELAWQSILGHVVSYMTRYY